MVPWWRVPRLTSPTAWSGSPAGDSNAPSKIIKEPWFLGAGASLYLTILLTSSVSHILCPAYLRSVTLLCSIVPHCIIHSYVSMFQIGTWLCSFKTYSLKRSLTIVFVLDRSVFTQKFLTFSTGSLRTCITN